MPLSMLTMSYNKMTCPQFELNMAKTQMNKAVSFMTKATFMTLPQFFFRRSRSISWQPHFILHHHHYLCVHLATFTFVHVAKIMTLPHFHFIMTKIKMTLPRNVMTMAHINDYVTFFF
jgi:hypothetical protein